MPCPAPSLDPGQMGREQFLAISWRDLGGLRGRDRDFRNDRWSSCVWLSGYAQAETRILVAPPLSFGVIASDGQREEGAAAGISGL